MTNFNPERKLKTTQKRTNWRHIINWYC